MNVMLPHQPQIRRAIEDEIERLLSMLDAMDGDCDMEETGDDEPWIGGPLYMRNGTVGHDLEGDDSDCEPELGWTRHGMGFVDGDLPDGDDRESDDEREEDDEREADPAEYDAPGFIAGGNEDGPPH